MFKRLQVLIAAALLAGGFTPPSFGGTTNTYIVWNTEKDELLPQSSVIAMAQTADGYLWLGTMKGLVRFDGLHTRIYDPLGSATIVFLFADSRGGLWVGTEKSGVAFIRDGVMTNVVSGSSGAGGKLVGACEDASGAVWLCMEDGRLSRFRNGAKENDWLAADYGAGGFRAVIAESSGQVWVASAGLLSRVTSDVRAQTFALEMQPTRLPARQDFLIAARSGGYWQFYDGRILRCSTNRVVRDVGAYSWDQTRTPVRAVSEDADGNLFVGTYGEGVFRYDRQGGVTQITSPPLNHKSVLSLCLDREGCLWVGTDGGGLNRVKPPMFEIHPDTTGKTVQSVCEDGEGGLWIGLNGDFVNPIAVQHWRGGAFQQFGPAQGLANPVIRSVFVDSRQTVWVGGINNGGLFQLANGRFKLVSGTEGFQVSTIFEDRSSNLWVGAENGLARWDGRTWRGFGARDGMPSFAVRAMAEDKLGNIWIGTDGGGLVRFREGQFTSHRLSQGGLSGDSVSALLADADGALWVGTSGGGLARYQDGKWTRYTTREGLAGNSISYLIEDGLGFLWIGSNEGLMRVEKSALNNFAEARPEARVSTIHVRTFRKADGLPKKECTTGSQPAACRTRDGRLWFPTIQGLAGVNPAQLARNTNPPPVRIESVLVDDEPQGANSFQVNWPQDIVVAANKELLEIHFTSLNLSTPERTRFRYRLEGYKDDWRETRDMREVLYTKLPHGRYRFLVTACNEDGVWNPAPATLGIIVEPPFWKTWWFQAIVIVAILGATIGTVYFISTQRLQRQLAALRQQEALERERARIARDLHDQLGANLTQISLLGEMVESDKELPQEIEAHANQICQTARDTSHALDEIVWSANPRNDTLEGLVNYACKYAQDYLRVANLRYRLDVPTELPVTIIPPDLRHNVFLAFKESVNNVVKHAKASEVAIRLRLDGAMFTIEIEDDGRGPGEAASKTGRNGLRNMRKRMEDVGGTFTFEPGPGRGTRVRLTAPFKKQST